MTGIIGDPVRHSLSPLLHNAAFAAVGLDWVYVAFPVSAGQGYLAVGAMRTLGIDGLSVTMPHKAEVLTSLDRLSPTAKRLQSANTIVRDGDALVGYSTDGDGLIDALRSGPEGDPAGRRVLVLGTGGKARAVCLALAEAGAATVGVVGRRPAAVAAAVALCDGRGRGATVDELGDADLVINATPVGMDGGNPKSPVADTPIIGTNREEGGERGAPTWRRLPFDLDPGRLGPGQSVVDLIYHPLATDLVSASRARGATASNGLGMLIHQAARQFTLWTGVAAPVDVLKAAARAAVGE